MTFQSSRILQRHFLKMKEADGLSLRGWADSVGVSPTYLSLVLNSKRLPNLQMLKQLANGLDVDKLVVSDLKEAYQIDWLKKNKVSLPKTRKPHTKAAALNEDVEVTLMDDTQVLRSWLNLAIAEFTGCDGFTEDPERLSQIFSVHKADVQRSLTCLISSGFLIRDDSGRLKKQFQKVRFPTSSYCRQLIRDFHKQMILKAVKHMETRTDMKAFKSRTITGYTIAVNPDKIEQAQVMIQQALIDISRHLSDGQCTEIYQLQAQLFPLTTKK